MIDNLMTEIAPVGLTGRPDIQFGYAGQRYDSHPMQHGI